MPLLLACSSAEPYSLRLHVADEGICEPYEAALEDAVEFWSERNVDAFTFGDCIEDDFNASPLVHGIPGTAAHTMDLMQYSDHVPVYVVDKIILDVGMNEIAQPLAVGLPSDVVPCPGLVASTVEGAIPLAHELGHLLWLQHSDDPKNVMHSKQDESELQALRLSAKQVSDANRAFNDCERKRR